MEIELIDSGCLRIGDSMLSTHDLDELIAALAVARNQMEPPIALHWEPRQDVDSVADAAAKIGPIGGGRVMLAFSHPGFGWCCFDFGERGAAFLRDALVRHATGPAGPNLYAEIPNEPTPRH
jgi:hypothetical protein